MDLFRENGKSGFDVKISNTKIDLALKVKMTWYFRFLFNSISCCFTSQLLHELLVEMRGETWFGSHKIGKLDIYFSHISHS